MASTIFASPTLLGLPAEIRNTIWELALIEFELDPTTSLPTALRRKIQHIPSHCLTTTEDWPQPPLTRTNRQIRHETLSLSYELGIFSVTVSSMMMFPLRQWAEIIGIENVRRLKHVEVNWKAHDPYVRTRTNEMMAASRFRYSEIGQALDGALRYEHLFSGMKLV
ncbi:hypothetical protein LTR95_003889 [Oleoguttula sp. CCFEE 5521]|uniref:Uncharacterized protein n=1 Tax=Cryoendolithus antarcticus TaxID=1507870 RepID=A0A1V8TKH2_9PEZI|nr:hypothetical protein B0A48_03478 [Cryoendolithus antarcticus]